MKFRLLVAAASFVVFAACQNEQTESGLASSSSPGATHLQPRDQAQQSVTIKDASGTTIYASTAGGALSLTATIVNGKVVISAGGAAPAGRTPTKPDEDNCAPGQSCTRIIKPQGGSKPDNGGCDGPNQTGCPQGGNPIQ